MRKQEFLETLKMRLSALPRQEVEERLNFYSEMIDDRIEEGLLEEDAVSQIGSVDEIAAQIVGDIPLIKIAKEKIKPKRRLKAWEIVLLALGSPIWLSLAVAAVAVIFSLYVSLWSVILSLWAAFGALVGGAFGGVASGLGLVLGGVSFAGMAMVGAGIVCAGLSILMFFGCKAATRGALSLTKACAFGIKNCFIGKEKA